MIPTMQHSGKGTTMETQKASDLQGSGGREEHRGPLADGCLTHRRFNSAQIPQLG